MKIIARTGLALKLILSIFVSTAVIFAAIFFYNYSVSRKTIVKNLRENARNLTMSTVSRIEKVLTQVSTAADTLAGMIENSAGGPETGSPELLQRTVAANPDVFGAGLALEPGPASQSAARPPLYFYRENGTIREAAPGGARRDYATLDWYQIPKELGRPVWSEPYIDEDGGNIVVTTYSVPLYKSVAGEKTFAGVLTASLSLDWLRELVSSIRIYKTGYAWMISKNGSLVAHPIKDVIMNETVFTIAEENSSPILRTIGRAMIRGESSFAEVEYTNITTRKKSWLSYAPVSLNGWSLGIVYPVDEFMADVRGLNRTVLLLSAVGGAFLLFVIALISRSITGPLRRVAATAHRFAQGDYEASLPAVTSRDEIGTLNATFLYMQDALRRTIRELKTANDGLEEYSRTLEQKVEERTRMLSDKNRELNRAFSNLNQAHQALKDAQAQLVQSEKMASLGQLTAGIAHEIKNPLNFVNNFAELSIDLAKELREEIDKHKGRLSAEVTGTLEEIIGDLEHNVVKINEHGKRADSIVRGMLLHSRGKAGELQKTDINSLLTEYLNLAYHGFRAQDSAFNVKLETDLDPTLGPINVVPQDISRAFLNILNNACYSVNEKRKAQGGGFGPTISVSTRDAGGRVEIRIRDNGLGIPPEILDKVFNPFFTTKPAGKGTGLGLSLSFDIVVQVHKGELKADSAPGEYAEFTILLPKDLK